MQDKDFDRFIREALNNQQEPAYNPADWDMLEDRLANFNMPQAQPASGSAGIAGGSMAKLGFVASAVLFTALSTVAVLKPGIFESKKQDVALANKYQVVAEAKSENKPASNTVEIGETQVLTNKQKIESQEDQSNLASENIAGQHNLQAAENNSGNIQGSGQVILSRKYSVSKANNTKKNTSRNNTAQAWNSPFGKIAAFSNTPQSGNSGQNFGAGNPAGSGVADCNGNTKPELAYVLNGSDTLRTKRLNLTTCQALDLQLVATDKNGDKVTISSNIAEILPGAELTQLENNSARVEWKASPTMARQQPYLINFWFTDNSCAGVAPQNYQLAVSITPAFMVSLKSAASIEKGQATILEVVGAPKGSAYRWFTPNGIQNSVKSNRLEVAPAQSASYRVEVISPAGCVATDSARVEVIAPAITAETSQSRFIPNVITPNNDGSNDYFEAQLPEEGSVKLEIFDRYGKKVYSKDNYQNNWNASDLPAGTYYYSITAGQNNKIYKGWVEVVR